MLGVAIGVASITAILALSSGATKVVSDQVDSLGGNLIVVRPGKNIDPITDITQTQLNRNYTTSTITETDINYIKSIKHIQSVAPLMILGGTIKADSIAPNNSSVIATTPGLADVSNLKLREGQFLDTTTDQNTVVIGTQLSINIFGTESSIGRTLTIRGHQLTVIGVLKRIDNPINYNSVDFDNAAIINFAVGKKLNQNVAQIQQIDVRVDSVNNLSQAVDNLNKVIKQNHAGEDDFSILTGNQISQPTSQLFYAIAGVTTAIAAISLVVGGIGIMNIMLVTVAERTREIGIRKALGATNNDILWQFLIESLIIGIVGGISGYICGYVVAFVISTLLPFDPIMNWQIAGIALTVAIFIGTLFGIYPAIRAARKDPIESLHQYN
jgi:ABC-type antimicrobial peptide transport system permease subunit